MDTVRRHVTYQLKRKDPASWAAENPVLRFGEPGVAAIAGSGASGTLKIGDGVTPWNDLLPPGEDAAAEALAIAALIDAKVAEHNQATDVHATVTSGRDFVALFQNGLI